MYLEHLATPAHQTYSTAGAKRMQGKSRAAEMAEPKRNPPGRSALSVGEQCSALRRFQDQVKDAVRDPTFGFVVV